MLSSLAPKTSPQIVHKTGLRMTTSHGTIVYAIILIWLSVYVVEGYQDAYGKWSTCPQGYLLMNSLCYKRNMCQDGYALQSDGLCHSIKTELCPYATTTPTPCVIATPQQRPPPATTTRTPTPTTTEEPEMATEEVTYAPTISPPPLDEQVRCPSGSIFYMNQCRKIICTRGEYHAGLCLSSACPVGTVWRGRRCQAPGYVTTILEIDNVIKNKHEYKAVTENVHLVEYESSKSYDPSVDSSYTQSKPAAKLVATLPPRTDPLAPLSPGCCTVKSPRICRPYPPTWVCFNRSHKLCDPRICTSPVVYLKPPQVVQLTSPPILVMPPNPPMSACKSPDCQENMMLNCSGCGQGLRESCSASCYNYFCPGNSCEYKKSEDFCALYPGGFGCTRDDGCIWKWCD